MLFNSSEFLIFLPVVFALYWFVFHKNLNLQNGLVLAASYFFYGWWDWRFLSLLIISSVGDYCVGLGLHHLSNDTAKKRLFGVSLFVNLGLLGVFKYYNFFSDSLIRLFLDFGIVLHPLTLQIVLPVGISFYTFQSLSYTIDVYRKEIQPTRNLIQFLAFVSFFPQLVAGPIERARQLLPQFERSRTFDYDDAVDGLRQMLWGFIKKIVIADTCARNADFIFSNYTWIDGSVLFLGVIYFSFQIYCDFSGYSDIAIGCAKLFGISLNRNFDLPYFSRGIREFWKRWHISLSTWFRDYVYIPLGGNRVSRAHQAWNILITFTVSGLWHGANWTFVIWGFLHGVGCAATLFLPKQLEAVSNRHSDTSFFPSLREAGLITGTFLYVMVGWVFFRASSLSHALGYLDRMFSTSLFTLPSGYRFDLLLIGALVSVEWVQRKKAHGLDFEFLPTPVRWAIYYGLIFLTLGYLQDQRTFIYFQF